MNGFINYKDSIDVVKIKIKYGVSLCLVLYSEVLYDVSI